MTGARVNIIGIDSSGKRWFWDPWGNCFIDSPNGGCNYSSKMAAAENIGCTATWQRNQDPDDRMVEILIEEVK